MIRDDIAVRNERLKLTANALNALALGMIGFAILRPASESFELLRQQAWLWGCGGLVFHVMAHYILGYIKKAKPDEH